ncbi:MAG: NDP-sugar synthase [Phycisphaerae bacterium]
MSSGAKASVGGVVLAGVHRWNDAPFDAALPRPLVPIGQSPLIAYSLQWMAEGGISNVMICANSASRAVRRRLGDGTSLGLHLDYYEDWTPRGPAGCARDATAFSEAGQLVIVEGTILPRIDLLELMAEHQRSGAVMTVVVQRDANSGNDEQFEPAGVYVARRRALEYVPETGYQDIKEMLIPRLHRVGEHVATYSSGEISPRITGLASYMAVNGWVLDRASNGHVRVDHSAEIADDVQIVGPVMIGPRTRIESGVTIVGPTTIGGECRIEPNCVISRSVLWDHCRVGGSSILDRCVLTNETALPAETRTSEQCFAPRRRRVRRVRKPARAVRPVSVPPRLGDAEVAVRQARAGLIGAGQASQS